MTSTPPITIGDLLDASSLQLSLLAGKGGAENAVLWTHVSELPDPAVWLDGGELLITNGLGISPEPDQQRALIESLSERGAVGLAIGIRGPELHPRVLSLADELDFPLLHVPREVPFLSIARMVADANQEGSRQRLLTQVRFFDALRPTPDGLDSEATFEKLEEVSGYDLYCVSEHGTPLAGAHRRPSDEVLELVKERLSLTSESSPTVDGGYIVPIPMEGREGAYLVAMRRDAGWHAGLGSLRHIATIAALHLSTTYYRRELSRRRGAEVLSGLFTGSIDPSTANASFEQLRLDPADPYIICAIRSKSGPLPDDAIYERLCDQELAPLMLQEGELAFALISGEHTIDVLSAALEGLPINAGTSRAKVGMSHLTPARKEAVWAMERAASSHQTQVCAFSDSDTYGLWLPADIDGLEHLVGSVLGPIMAYDQETNSELLRTLEAFFAHERQKNTAANELGIHKHTLTYRLGRIEDLTHRDLSTMSDLCAFWLAIQAHRVVRTQSLADPAK